MVAKKHTPTDNKTSAFSPSFGMLNLTLFSFTLAGHQPPHFTTDLWGRGNEVSSRDQATENGKTTE
jgi:hypothetical protein